jgi:hydrogenase-4 component B
MGLLLAAFFLPALGGALSLPAAHRPFLRTLFGAGGSMAGSACGLAASLQILISGTAVSFSAPWHMPLGSFSFSVDALSAVFLVPLFVLSLCCALYGTGYTKHESGASQAGQWFFFNILLSSMSVVVCAANGLLFLIAWEMMSLSSFFLVLHRQNEAESREAAWIYLIATHIGSAFLLGFFLFAASQTGSLEFGSFTTHVFPPLVSSVLFAAGLIGFGSKAGFVPFHVWLPRAHPAAPSHVSAMMSGIMIKMGIYGILRMLTFFGAYQAWWGIALIAIGCVSGVLGVLLALGQHDLKRLLAYHSVENVGIIALGIGAGVLGVCFDVPLLAVFGFLGGIVHVVNHALFKGLLFLGAGSVLHHTGTANLDSLGGLIKKIPSTAVSFLIGSIAICGLPPLNGFVSEFCIYVAGYSGLCSSAIPPFAFSAALMVSLALIGGLAVACFTKAFGTVFLGEPRTAITVRHAVGASMNVPMYTLCVLCGAIGIGFPLLCPFLMAPLAIVLHAPVADVSPVVARMAHGLAGVSIGAALLGVLVAGLTLLRRRLLAGRPVTASPTWDCGYNAPTPRMQYTSSSFAQPLVSFFKFFLFTKTELAMPGIGTEPLPPKSWRFHSHVPDLFLDNIYIPAFRLVAKVLSRLRWLQGGRVHNYVLYIALTLIVLLLGMFLWNR